MSRSRTGRVAGVCIAAAVAALLAVSAPARAGDVTVFAAASLKDAMDDVADLWAETTDHTAKVALAGSSTLARQIQQGAPVDVFISANTAWMDRLEADGLIVAERRVDLLRNTLVLVGHGHGDDAVDLSDPAALPARLGDGRLAMALVEAVPAGIYGKAALQSLGLWRTLEPRVAQADNVRAALALVSTGEAPLGIVYGTDAAADDSVSVLATFPEDSHPPIVYPAAPLADSTNALADRFVDFLQGPEARSAFERQGFYVTGG